jgi:hypothetical protein
MTRLITFGGVTTPLPGAYSKTDFSAGAQPSSASVGVIGIIGESDQGNPGEVLVFDDDKSMREYFGSGPLADSARTLFRASTDPFIPGGASRVYAYKTNNSTQAVLPLYAGAPVVTERTNIATSPNNDSGFIVLKAALTPFAGLDLGGQTVEITTGRGAGQRRVIDSNTDDTLTIGASGSGLEWSPDPDLASGFTVYHTQAVLNSANSGELFNSIEFDLDSADGSGDKRNPFRTIVEIQDSLDLDSGAVGTPMFHLEYDSQAQVTINADDESDTTANDTSVRSTTSIVTANDEFNNLFVYIDDPLSASAWDLRKVDDTTEAGANDVLTVFSAFTGGILADGDDFQVRSGVIGSSAVTSATTTVVTLNTVYNATTNPTPFKPADTELAGLMLVVASGAGSGQSRKISANGSSGGAFTVTADEGFSIPLDASSVVEVHYVNHAEAAVTGTAGVANRFKTGVLLNSTPPAGANTGTVDGASTTDTIIASAGTFTAADAGKFIYDDGTGQFGFIGQFVSGTEVKLAKPLATAPSGEWFVVDPDLDLAILTTSTVQDFVTTLTSKTGYRAVVGSGVNPQKTFPKDLDFDGNNINVDLKNDAQAPGIDSRFTFQLHLLVQALNNQSSLVSATRSTADGPSGAGLPNFIAQPLFFEGASRGTSANSDWQNGFDSFLLHRINHVVPAMSSDLSDQGLGSTASIQSVAQMLNSHVTSARLAKEERTGFVGLDGTKSQLLQTRGILSNFLMQLVGQGITVPNAAGDSTSFGAWMGAAAAASMRAGGNDESLTNKSISTAAITQDSSWDPRNTTDLKDMLLNGVLTMVPAATGGFRWARDLTTEIGQENTLLNIGATVWNWMQTIYNVRTAIEDRFTGVKALPRTPAGVKNFTRAALTREEEAGRISGSVLADGSRLPAFTIGTITISADIMRIPIKISVTGYVDFILIDASLEIPILEA